MGGSRRFPYFSTIELVFDRLTRARWGSWTVLAHSLFSYRFAQIEVAETEVAKMVAQTEVVRGGFALRRESRLFAVLPHGRRMRNPNDVDLVWLVMEREYAA